MSLVEQALSASSALWVVKLACITTALSLMAALALGKLRRFWGNPAQGAVPLPQPLRRESLTRTLFEERLRPALGHQMMQSTLASVLIALSGDWPLIGGADWDQPFLLMTKFGLIALLIWHAARIWLWELRYDAIGVSAPGWLLQREARLWRELCQVSTDGPFVLQLHFADGLVMRLPNSIHGRDDLLQEALYWLPDTMEPPHPTHIPLTRAA